MTLAVSALFDPGFIGTAGRDYLATAITPMESASDGSAVALSLRYIALSDWAARVDTIYFLRKTAQGFAWEPSLDFQPGSDIARLCDEIDDTRFPHLMKRLDIQADSEFELVFYPGVTVMANFGWEDSIAKALQDPDEAQDLIDRELVAILPNETSAHGRLQATNAVSRLPALLSAFADPDIPLPSFTVELEL